MRVQWASVRRERQQILSYSDQWVVAGLDVGGTTINATLLDATGRFLVEDMAESPSLVREGPDKAIEALSRSLDDVLDLTGAPRTAVRAVGLDTPGPVTANGVISVKGATNFANAEWRGFDVRHALEERLGIPVVFNNDANAAALYAHHQHFGPELAYQRSCTVSVIVGTGLGGGVVESGRVIVGAAGMAGELGHIWLPLMEGLLAPWGQTMPTCNCGLPGDAESVASLTGIEKNLLPFWLTQYPGHELAGKPASVAAKLVRAYGEAGDQLALSIFEQQAMAIGRLLTIAANFTDPHVLIWCSAGASSRRRRRSATGSWTACAPTRCCAKSRNGRRRSRWSLTWTWLEPVALPSPLARPS